MTRLLTIKRSSTFLLSIIFLLAGGGIDTARAQEGLISSAKTIFESEYIDKKITDGGYYDLRPKVYEDVAMLEPNLWLGWKIYLGTILPNWSSAKVLGSKVEVDIDAGGGFVALSGAYTYPELPPHSVYVSQRLVIDIRDGSLFAACLIPEYRPDISEDSGNRDPFDGDGVVLYYDLTGWDLVMVERQKNGEVVSSAKSSDIDFLQNAREVIDKTFVGIRPKPKDQDEIDRISDYYEKLKSTKLN